MDRIINFRTWDGEQMVSPDYIDRDGHAHWKANSIPQHSGVHGYPLMQFTGLLDKDGKEIFEGDVLSFTVFDHNDADTQYRGCVVWADAGWRIWSKPDHEYYGSDGGFDLGWVHDQDDEIEVVGNVFEHRALLEAK